jgi:hypothetical protein
MPRPRRARGRGTRHALSRNERCNRLGGQRRWSRALPRVRKCDLCAERVAAGKPTACSEICPTGATITGERDALIAEAHRRIAANPSQYHAHVFGETEAGGRSVLMLAATPFEALGIDPTLPHEALPRLTWRALSLVPTVVVLGGARREGEAVMSDTRRSMRALFWRALFWAILAAGAHAMVIRFTR